MAAVEFLDEPEPWLLMPYFSQGYLGELWTPSEEECASALRQILAGLSYLHANGVVHRDLKPRNLLVGGPAYTIVITDFGLSRASVGDSLIKSFVGSMKYLAPEVVPGASSGYGPTVDVYAAGVIIMEQMYGTPDPPELPAAGVSAAVDAIWDWSQRWAEQLVQNLDEWSDNEDLVLTLLRRMIVVNPEDRLSARECLETGCEIRLFRRTDDGRVMDMVDVNRAPSEATTEIDPAEDDRTKTPVQ
jgi:serine/threonine protein kinase